jgi:hypothetical protein
VLQGRPTVRHPQGEDELQPWDVVFFPPGPDGAHAVRNDADSTARVLMFSSTSTVAASLYPDSNKIRHLDWKRRRRHHRQAYERSRLLGWREPTWIVRALACHRPRMAGRREALQLLNFPALAATSRHGMAATFDPKVGGSIPPRRVGPASGSAATRSSPWASAGASARSPNG